MAGADIGGDTSVEWTVAADNFRKNNPPTGAQNGNGWRHHGIDEVDIGPGHDFTISIKIPNDVNNAAILANTLNQAAAAATNQVGQPGSRVSFTLPIEPQSPDQIQVRWESSAEAAGHHGRAAMARGISAGGGKKKKKPSKKTFKKGLKKKTSPKKKR